MKKEYKTVINFFGEEWFQSNWEKFRAVQTKENRNSFSSRLILHEISLHPLLADVFRYQYLENQKINFLLIKPNSPSDFHLSHLGRDLNLLEHEISERGFLIKKDLFKPEEYESHRLTLMVAAGYKIEGYKVCFVPTSNIKKADLLVSKGDTNFYIENKRINQQTSDQQRYDYFAKLVERTFKLLRVKNYDSTVVGIDAKGDINNHAITIDRVISNRIWRNQKYKETLRLSIKFSTLTIGSEIYMFLKRMGHFNQTPVYTRAEDFLIASDPTYKNIILLNKNVSSNEIPSRINSLLEDANSKHKEEKKLIVYLDIGRGMSEWNSNISDYLAKIISTQEDIFPNIDTFVVCQTSLKHLGDIVQIKPNFNIIGDTVKLGGTPENFNLFGFQGHTGMDNYLIKEFLNPVPYSSKLGQKYIECLDCGYKIVGISSNLQEGELISQVKMPCEQCGSYMDMVLKIIK